ncbi:GNAT family N-acetyltransferase [Pseudonocardia phyllosphaerae]|uniref:GNAT family N-acetyltransferase n=1 Tax=Pseudonocardia phyllosphaerae TaxID=3390502 RepID=UPI00397A655A
MVVVLEGDRLVGIAPFHLERARGRRSVYKPFAAGFTHRVGPLAEPGRECEIAVAVADALAWSTPVPTAVALEAIDAEEPWPELIATTWPGRPARVVDWRRAPAPVVEMDGDHEAWLAARSSNFRQQMRRGRRNLEKLGGSFRAVTDAAEAPTVIHDMMELHHRRWSHMGGSGLGASTEPAVVRAAKDMLGDGRMRLWILEAEGRLVCGHALISAGGETLHWNSGFDEAWASLKPSVITLWLAVQDCFARGDRRLDLSGGDASYKIRFATGDAPLRWCSIVPREPRSFPMLAGLCIGRVAERAGRRLAEVLGPRVRARGRALGVRVASFRAATKPPQEDSAPGQSEPRQ